MQQELLEAIGVFYDSVGDEFDYDAALKAYSAMAEDTGVALSEIKPLVGKVIVRGFHNLSLEALDGWKAGKKKCPQRAVLQRALIRVPIHIPVMRRTFVSDVDWQKSETFKRVAGPWGYHGDGTSIISKGIWKIITCGFARTPEQEEIRADTLVTMAFMNKHLGRAMAMQNRISRVEQMLIESRNVLDLIEFGVVLYNADKSAVFVNSSAQQIFDKGDGISYRSAEIEIDDSKTGQMFTKLLNDTCREDVALSSRAGGMLSIPRSTGRRAYTLTIVPMRGSFVDNNNVTAVAFIFDPLKKQTTTFNVVADCYNFTSTEAELAVSLMHGASLEESAQKRGVSYNTMKTHLHSIFSKTNTNRQVDLVSLLLRSVAGFRLEN